MVIIFKLKNQAWYEGHSSSDEGFGRENVFLCCIPFNSVIYTQTFLSIRLMLIYTMWHIKSHVYLSKVILLLLTPLPWPYTYLLLKQHLFLYWDIFLLYYIIIMALVITKVTASLVRLMQTGGSCNVAWNPWLGCMQYRYVIFLVWCPQIYCCY